MARQYDYRDVIHSGYFTWLAVSVLVVMQVLVGARWVTAEESKETAPLKPTDGVIRLFNGKNLEGLYTWLRDSKYEDPRQVFTIDNGLLHISGDGWGGISTKQSYRDYHLICEFKWGERTWDERKEAARDSGILVHCHGPDGAFSDRWPASVEVQIIEGGIGDLFVIPGTYADGSPVKPLSLSVESTLDENGEPIWKKGGELKAYTNGRINWYGRDPKWDDVLGFRGANDVDNPVGEWNRLDVICDGGHILVKVNGVVVNEGFKAEPPAGKILIQSELAEIFVRRWELWPLGKAPEPEAPKPSASTGGKEDREFRAGAFAIDVSPTVFPVIINGSMMEKTGTKLIDPLHARCLVLDDGTEQLAIAVVDSCMMPRALLDRAKELASQSTGIPTDRILISATHTHSAPSVMPILGSRRDETYTNYLPAQIAKGIKLAQEQLTPARIGWAMGRDEEDVGCRRWLMKPGTVPANPFGVTDERVQMHPGFGNPNAIRPTGPVDPEVAVLSVQTRDGLPLALLANYSMHYVDSPAVSADYFSDFCNEIERLIGADNGSQPFVAMLSNGTSGDAYCIDYNKPPRTYDRLSVAKNVAQAAYQAYQTIQYYDWVPLVMEEQLLPLEVRMPSASEVAQAKSMLDEKAKKRSDDPPTVPEVYARETVALSQMPPTRELKLQAIRVGDLGITAIPNEVFGSTGLELKEKSPMAMTFNIGLANGAEGYIPPPDQHPLGGYTTWRARTSCLEVEAEPKIKEAVLGLLKDVAGCRSDEEPISSQTSTSGSLARKKIEKETEPEEVPSPISASESLNYIYLHDGFQVEVIAQEPMVIDPVAFDWGPDGKLWVVEMGDYPLGLDGKGMPGGRVRFLEDTTGDGKYDKSTLFATGIPFPNGISVWRNGVIVTSAPDIIYLEDSNGDGKADVHRQLYVGLTEGNPQLRANALRWGLDGWLYCANGLSSVGEVKSIQTGESVSIRGRDFRIRPDEGVIDPQLGSTQFGRNRDDWGNWFGVSNGNPMWHYVLADQYLRRNTHVATPNCLHDVSITPGKANVYGRSAKGVFFHESEVGIITSANSTIRFRDHSFGKEFYQNSFVSDPAHNLIHREVLQPNGVTFSSQRAPEEQDCEFLASSDTWFRPNMLRTGPDGTLWFADMYRQIIDHPEYIPEEFHKSLNFRNGDKLGRIYRVLPKGKQPSPIPRLDKMNDSELVSLLESPNGTLRDMVQKQIVWRNLQSAVPLLEKQAASSESGACRLQSLWTLECLGALRPGLVLKALNDLHPGVRRGAVRLSEQKFECSPQLGTKLTEMVHDPNPQVRLQVACTLGEWHDPRAAEALAQLGLQGASEPLFITAVISSIRADNVGAVLDTVLSTPGDLPESLVGQLLESALGYEQIDVVRRSFEKIAVPQADGYSRWQLTALDTLSDRLWIRHASLGDLVADKDSKDSAALEGLEVLFENVRRIAVDPDEAIETRVLVLPLLGHQGMHVEEDRELLAGLLVPQEPLEIQAATIEALTGLGGDDTASCLLESWELFTPGIRSQVLDLLLSRPDWTAALLDEIEQGLIAVSGLDAGQRDRLLTYPDRELHDRAAKLLAGSLNTARHQLIKEWEPVLALKGDAVRGAAVFKDRCAVCHQLDEQGHSVGPDLSALTDRSPLSYLQSILDPNLSIDSRYLSYLVVTSEGRVYSGVLVQESNVSITIKAQGNVMYVLMREDLEAIKCTGRSLMPDGLEKDMTQQNMADLIAYVAQMGPDSTVPAE